MRVSTCTSDGGVIVDEIAEDVVVREPEEEEERDREDDDDGEHLAAHGLAEAVADDDAHRAHDVSPPTASR